MRPFNINESVLVRLNDKGRALHRNDHLNFWKSVGKHMPYTAPKEDKDGYSSWQLWSLMKAFGPHMGLGLFVPFDAEIQLNDPYSAQLEARIKELEAKNAELEAKLDICKRYAEGEVHDPIDLAIDYGGTGWETDPACVAIANLAARATPQPARRDASSVLSAAIDRSIALFGEVNVAQMLIQSAQEPVAWMIWTHGPVLVFMNKDDAGLEFDRLNRKHPEPARKLLPLYTAPQAPNTADTARLNWLNQNFFSREKNAWDAALHADATQWVFFAPQGVQGDVRVVIDAAMQTPKTGAQA